MKTHTLKTWPDPFEAVFSGRKMFEIRWDDRGFEVGDLLDLREWDPKQEAATGRCLLFKVTHIERGPAWGLPDHMVVMSLGTIGEADYGVGAMHEPFDYVAEGQSPTLFDVITKHGIHAPDEDDLATLAKRCRRTVGLPVTHESNALWCRAVDRGVEQVPRREGESDIDHRGRISRMIRDGKL